MHLNITENLKLLPPEYPMELLPAIRNEFLESNKTIIVLDDDPTGTQTCTEVTVLTSWDTKALTEELIIKPSILFILSNSRSLTEPDAISLAQKIGYQIKEAVQASSREVI